MTQTETQDQVFPAKCTHCNRPMSSPVVCDYCHAMSPAAVGADHFTLLGLEPRFDLDEADLQRRYVALSRHAHPDYHTGDTEEVQTLHLRVSASLNDAYRTLKDPAARGEYLLQLLGGKNSADDKTVPEGFLGTMMLLQEEIADAQAARQQDELDRIRDVLQTRRDGLLKRIARLFAEHQEAIACEAVRTDYLGEIRKQLNALSYARKLVSML